MSSLKAYVHTTRSFRTGLGLRKHKKTKFIYLRFVDPNPPSPLGVRLVLAFVLPLVLAFALALVSLVLFSLRHVAVQVTGKAEGTQVAFLVQVFHNWPVFALDGRSQPFCMPT